MCKFSLQELWLLGTPQTFTLPAGPTPIMRCDGFRLLSFLSCPRRLWDWQELEGHNLTCLACPTQSDLFTFCLSGQWVPRWPRKAVGLSFTGGPNYGVY